MVKRFLVFAGKEYDMGGGFNDYAGYRFTLSEAQEYADNLRTMWDWAHVVDLLTEQVVYNAPNVKVVS